MSHLAVHRGFVASAALSMWVSCLPPGGDPGLDQGGEADRPTLFLELAPSEFEQSPPAEGSAAVRAAVFVGVREQDWSPSDVDAAQAQALIEEMLQDADDVLQPCAIHLELEAAQVIGLSNDLMDIAGNHEGSYGGHPPEGTTDPAGFNYAQGERLTAATRELFTYGKRFTHPNAIAAFTVGRIDYWTQEGRTPAGGLSFPPNSYHHADDYPMRNSVLLAPRYPSFDALPSAPAREVLAHEFAHMLLNSGLHDPDVVNLLGSGDQLRAEQCERMLDGLGRLFGEEAVPDPGVPGGEL